MSKITKITTAVVQANFHWTYVRVYSDADGGLYGTGECFFAPGLPQIINEFAQILIGEDFRDIEKLVERMRWSASGAGSMGGIIWNAITGIEAALWDLKARYYDVPVYQLLGGKFCDEVRLYLDCHAAGALECLSPLLQETTPSWVIKHPEPALSAEDIITASAARAQELAALGYTALKFDLDLPESRFDSPTGYALSSKDIDWMARLTHGIRDALGPGVDLAMDAHWRYRANEVLSVAESIADCHLMWLEDPVPPDDSAALAYLRQHTTVPIGTGENLQLRQGFWNLITQDLCDVITPDLQKAGGLAEGRKIADMCATANKPIAIHMIGSPLALMASAHLAMTIPNFMVCEFHAYDVPFFHELVDEADWFRHGWVTPQERPGFGLTLNESVASQYKVPNTTWFDEV